MDIAHLFIDAKAEGTNTLQASCHFLIYCNGTGSPLEELHNAAAITHHVLCLMKMRLRALHPVATHEYQERKTSNSF